MRKELGGIIPVVCGLAVLAVLLLGLSSVVEETQAAALPSPEQVEVRVPQAVLANGESERPLIVALNSEPWLDFRVNVSLDDLQVLSQVMEGLYRHAPDGSVEPAGATGHAVSADGLVYTFTLRSDARWWDGAPVTAQHYVDSYLRLFDPDNNPNPDNPTGYAWMVVGLIKGADGYMRGDIIDPNQVGVAALDATTLQYTLEHRVSYFPSLMANGAFCPVRLDLIDSDPDYWTEAGHFVGNGPYEMTEWVHDSYLVLAKASTYHSQWQGTMEEIRIRILSDEEQLAAYENDQLDVSVVPSDELPRVLTDSVLAGELEQTPRLGLHYLGVNTQLTPTNNITVRMALASAIDRSDILTNELHMPWREPATSVIPRGVSGYQNGEVGYTFNPTQAQAYLAAAGYPGGVGFPGVELWSNYGHETIFDAVADHWRTNLNIAVTTVYTDWNPNYADYLANCHDDPGACDYNAYRMGWIMDYADAHNLLNDVFHPEFGIQNTGWDSDRYRELIDMTITETNQISRTAYFAEADRILVEDEVAVIPLYFYDHERLIKQDILSEYAPFGGPYFMNWRFTATVTDTITDAGGTITAPDGDVMVEFPDGAVSDQVVVTYTSFYVPPHPPTSTFVFAGSAFQLEVAEIGTGVQITTFAEALTLTIDYTDGDLGGIDEDTLELRYWDGSSWVTDGITIIERDTVNNRLVVQIEHLTVFALLGKHRVYLPMIVRNR